MELIRFALILFLFPLIACGAVSREQCGEVDHSRLLGPNRNQANSDWCWASSAADLITFAQGIGPMNQASLIDTALTGLTATEQSLREAGELSDWGTYQAARSEAPYLTASERRKRGLRLLDRQGWSLTAVISYNRQARVCLEHEVSSRPATPFLPGRWAPAPFVPRGPAPSLPPLPEKERAELDFIERQLAGYGDSSFDLKNLSLTQRLLFACENELAPPLQRHSSLFEEYNQVVLRHVAEGVRAKCKRGPPVKRMRAEVRDFQRGPDSKSAELAAEWLGEGPVSVSVPSELLAPGKPRSKWHEAVIAGRRWNERTGACEFKLRDSYGESCGRFHRELQARCDRGNVWLTERELLDSARFVTRVRAR